MAEQRTRSKYWLGRPAIGRDTRTLRERVEYWSRGPDAGLDRSDHSNETERSSSMAGTDHPMTRFDPAASNLSNDDGQHPIKEMIQRRRRSDRPFAGVSTQTLIRRLKRGVMTDEAQRSATEELALRSDRMETERSLIRLEIDA